MARRDYARVARRKAQGQSPAPGLSRTHSPDPRDRKTPSDCVQKIVKPRHDEVYSSPGPLFADRLLGTPGCGDSKPLA
jgi:hypothetical protein